MTQNLLTDLGEEYLIKNGLDGITVTVGVYNDSEDGLSDSSDIGSITSEPGNSNYSRKSVTFSAADLSGNWGVDNDSQFVFDFSDTTTSDVVDTGFVAYSFQAEDTGDASSNLHLLANPALTQDRDIGSIDELRVDPGDLDIRLD
jgi:hypothetical protein